MKWRFWVRPRELRRAGFLGINERNLRYLSVHNPRGLYPLVDDKVNTKDVCRSRGIPVPETYQIIQRFGDIGTFPALLPERADFVVKPARGAGGRGILVIRGSIAGSYNAAGHPALPLADLRYHLAAILAGLYSLGGRPDRALVEERIERHPVFDALVAEGTPDIRVIVYRGFPVLAMLRLPTGASGGRANLHQGAIGVGIDLERGLTRGGICLGRRVTRHPDTGAPLRKRSIPRWPEVLNVAAETGRALGLGMLGVDIVIDQLRGPIVLEANARPGLAVQVANAAGLRPRCDAVDRSLGGDSVPGRASHMAMVTRFDSPVTAPR